MADGSCEYPQQGYDCDGNINVQVGDEAFGGIVFYLDSTGQHGLVAAMEDLEGLYEWGCYGTLISGADGQAIGTGYQNTLDIVAGCSETPIASSEALAYESEGYSDWYLPSQGELYQMCINIGQGSENGHIGVFENFWYWSSSEKSSNLAWVVNFPDGYLTDTSKDNKPYIGGVRPIRSF